MTSPVSAPSEAIEAAANFSGVPFSVAPASAVVSEDRSLALLIFQEVKDLSESREAPIDLKTFLAAVQSFDAGRDGGLAGASASLSSPPPTTGRPEVETTSSPAITSWTLTNALLEFHLNRADAAGFDGAVADFVSIHAGIPGIGIRAEGLWPGSSGLGESASQLRTFSGLQEGFARLG